MAVVFLISEYGFLSYQTSAGSVGRSVFLLFRAAVVGCHYGSVRLSLCGPVSLGLAPAAGD